LTGLSCSNNEVAQWNGSAWVCANPLTGVVTLASLSCSNGDVAQFDGTNWVCTPDPDNDILAALSCSNGEVASWNGSAWVCTDPLTGLDTLSALSCSNGEYASWNGSNWICSNPFGGGTLGSLSCSSGEGPQWNGSAWVCASSTTPDNLGNHIATQALDMATFDIDDAGTVTATQYMHSSDRRLKTEIKDIDNPFGLLNAIHGKHYLWKKDGVAAYGVIAQDVEKVMPEAVSTNPKTDLKAVEYDQLIAPLIEAVKILKVENDDIINRIEILETKHDR